MKPLLIAALLFCSNPAVGMMCGDCNNDGKVIIHELITAVNNAFNPTDECEFGCFNTNLCPENCNEFPTITIHGITFTCAVSICIRSQEQLNHCVLNLWATTENICSVVEQ